MYCADFPSISTQTPPPPSPFPPRAHAHAHKHHTHERSCASQMHKISRLCSCALKRTLALPAFPVIKAGALGCWLRAVWDKEQYLWGPFSLKEPLVCEGGGEAQRECRGGSTAQRKARPFIIVRQMKEAKCLFLPPIPFSLPISPFLGFFLSLHRPPPFHHQLSFSLLIYVPPLCPNPVGVE